MIYICLIIYRIITFFLCIHCPKILNSIMKKATNVTIYTSALHVWRIRYTQMHARKLHLYRIDYNYTCKMHNCVLLLWCGYLQNHCKGNLILLHSILHTYVMYIFVPIVLCTNRNFIILVYMHMIIGMHIFSAYIIWTPPNIWMLSLFFSFNLWGWGRVCFVLCIHWPAIMQNSSCQSEITHHRPIN